MAQTGKCTAKAPALTFLTALALSTTQKTLHNLQFSQMKSLTPSREEFLRQCGPLREGRKGVVNAETRTRIVCMECAANVGLSLSPAWVNPNSAFIDSYCFFCTVVVLQLSMEQDTSWQALLPSPDGT